MPSQGSEKQLLEYAACQCFLDTYNRLHQTHFELLEHGDKPDFLVRDSQSSEKIGVEVTHLYYDGKEAKMLLGRRPKEPHGVMTMDQLIAQLNSLLYEKVGRAAKYDFEGRLFLLVRVGSPIFDKADFDMWEDEISVPPFNLFDQIWLLFRNQTNNTFSDLTQIQ